MSLKKRVALGCVALSLLSGCRGGMPPRRALTANEPTLDGAGDGGAVVADVPRTGSSPAFVDRHPLFSKPRDYYASSGENKVVKTAAATVIGIPAGVVGELRQIVVGAPAAPR